MNKTIFNNIIKYNDYIEEQACNEKIIINDYIETQPFDTLTLNQTTPPGYSYTFRNCSYSSTGWTQKYYDTELNDCNWYPIKVRKKCSQCATSVGDDDNFCKNCGCMLNKQVTDHGDKRKLIVITEDDVKNTNGVD